MSYGETTTPNDRLVSIDAYRGLVMLALASGGFGLLNTAKAIQNARDSAGEPLETPWRVVLTQFEHPEWVSNFNYVFCSAWDLIQPSFMFLVGTALAFSYAKRKQFGQGWFRRFGHALFRSAVLILLGVFLRSVYAKQTNWTFEDVLSQIGLGFPFVFLLAGRHFALQLLVAVATLAGYWYWFVSYPTPGAETYADHFQLNTNAAWAVDYHFLNLFPRATPWEANRGGYSTLNFIPAAVTMLFGLMAGQWLQSRADAVRKTLVLILFGTLCMVAAVAMSETGVCPIVKKIWTPSWTLFSGAWVLWILAFFYLMTDGIGYRGWAFPLVILGANSILLYVMGGLLRPWVLAQLKIHFGADFAGGGFNIETNPYVYIKESFAVMMVFWLVCLWLYAKRIFVRI